MGFLLTRRFLYVNEMGFLLTCRILYVNDMGTCIHVSSRHIVIKGRVKWNEVISVKFNGEHRVMQNNDGSLDESYVYRSRLERRKP